MKVEELPDMADRLMAVEERLAMELMQLEFREPVDVVYNPIEHAKDLHLNFLKKFYSDPCPRPILFLGMNPGPWGMVQTGVPFGEVATVRDYLKVTGEVTPPEREHPKRRVQGLACKRKEVSGSRFWDFVRVTCGDPVNFTRHCLVYNYCPLSFMAASGKNVTPQEIKFDARHRLFDLCDEALAQVLELFGTTKIVGLGRYVESRAVKLVRRNGLQQSISTHFLLHPSPASPAANTGWNRIAEKTLKESGIWSTIASVPAGTVDFPGHWQENDLIRDPVRCPPPPV